MKKRKLKSDGTPLDRDEFLHQIGHDFQPENIKDLGDIRTGWPKTAKDYPKGYAVASPPGFCWEGCDCMDDQRPQRSWETFKAWLDDKDRSAQVNAAIEHFSAQGNFVRRRGTVSKMCFFETAMDAKPDYTHENAALDLAGSIGRRVGEVLKAIPMQAVQVNTGPRVFIPAVAFLAEELDAAPLLYKATCKGGAPLPPWLSVDTENGELIVSKDYVLTETKEFQLEFHHTEGVVGTATFTIAPKNILGSTLPWVQATANIIARFENATQCPIDQACRTVMAERLSEIWDPHTRQARNVTLGQWLKTASLILRMLRSTAVATITTPSARRR